MDKIRFIFPTCLCFLALSLSRGENLTTLDGHTFANITDIDKYSKLIVFTWNGTRKAVATTNLPDEFRAKHGIAIPTNAPETAAVAPQPQLSPADLFLFQNKDTRLFECDSAFVDTNAGRKSWQICLHGIQVELTRYIDENNPKGMQFQIGQEGMIDHVFDKFLEWDAIAQTNQPEDFEKTITSYRDLSFYTKYRDAAEMLDETDKFEFHWRNRQSFLYDSGESGIFDKNDVIHFKKLLTEIPGLKERLARKIQINEAQKDLFK